MSTAANISAHGPIIELEDGALAATVHLDGGRLASLRFDGVELLLTEGDRPTRWGAFPMAPWAGRLAHGRLRFDGKDHEFPLTSPPHANHGRSHLQQWTVVTDSEATPDQNAVTIRTELVEPWPYGGHVIQRFAIENDALTVTLELHAGDETMPGQVGWHPWFRRELKGVGGVDHGQPVDVQVTPGRAYEVDDDIIPTGALGPVPPPPWNECFVEVADGPTLVWLDALRVELTSNLDHWVVFTEPDHAVAVEPQSGPPNQLNRDPHVVEPGRPLIGSMTYAVTRA